MNKQPGIGTQEPVKKTARDRDPSTRGDEREVQGESVDIRHAELVHKERENTQMKSSTATWVKEASKSETHVGSCAVSNEECSGTTRYPTTRPLMEETIRSTLSSPKQAVEAMTTAIERAGENREKENAVFQVDVREQKDAQIQYIGRVVAPMASSSSKVTASPTQQKALIDHWSVDIFALRTSHRC